MVSRGLNSPWVLVKPDLRDTEYLGHKPVLAILPLASDPLPLASRAHVEVAWNMPVGGNLYLWRQSSIADAKGQRLMMTSHYTWSFRLLLV